MSTKIRIDRLEALLKHMRSDKRGHNEFNFSVYSTKISCGTAGCMAGELPFLWPGVWYFAVGCPLLCGGEHFSPQNSIREFFALSFSAVSHLFYADNQHTKEFGGVKLKQKSSLKKVTSNLEIFINKVKKGEIE